MEILFRLRFMTWELVEDLKIRHDIGLSRSLEQIVALNDHGLLFEIHVMIQTLSRLFLTWDQMMRVAVASSKLVTPDK